MEEALGEGGYNAVRGHGGWCATVIRPGRLGVGDQVTVLAPTADRPI
jgi:MOSC domain-containing protein YiiM